jgi:hypothetical protein
VFRNAYTDKYKFLRPLPYTRTLNSLYKLPPKGRRDHIFTINMQQKAEKSLALLSCGAAALQQMLKTIQEISP